MTDLTLNNCGCWVYNIYQTYLTYEAGQFMLAQTCIRVDDVNPKIKNRTHMPWVAEISKIL